IAEFVSSTNAALQQQFSGIEHVVFGHLGDGNLHYNVAAGDSWEDAELERVQADVSRLIYDQVHQFDGSISAEHGVGQLKRDTLPRYTEAVELSLMRSSKRALDPAGIMNPGKVV